MYRTLLFFWIAVIFTAVFLLGLFEGLAGAQTVPDPTTTHTPTCKTVCIGQPGPKGDKGDPGPRGPQGERGEKGEKGENGEYQRPRNRFVRSFDFGAHGYQFKVLQTFWRDDRLMLIAYSPAIAAVGNVPVALMVDATTGLAEVQVGFNAGVGNVTFTDVRVLDDTLQIAFAWEHGGAWWSDHWPVGKLPVVDLKTIIVDDPRLGRIPLFRFR